MDRKEKLISIIVPIYNVENYLVECINSVLVQTYTNFELLLVNDGSTDKSSTICKSYLEKDNRIRLFNKDNGGLSSARNHGLEHAVGEYIIFLDSDDYWISDKTLENLISIAQSTNADIVRGEYVEVDENGKNLYLPEVKGELLQIGNTTISNYVFVEKVLCRGHFSWLFLIKSSSIQNLRFNEEQKFQEDIEFNIRYFSIPRVCVYTSFRFYAYRKRKNSIMSTFKEDNLKYSFDLSYMWNLYSDRINNAELSDLYRFNAIMMYYKTLETMSQAPYYDNRLRLIKQMSLVNLGNRVRIWANSTKKIYPLPIYISPRLGISYFRLKSKIGVLWKKKIIIR